MPVEFADGGDLGGPVFGLEEALVEVADGLTELREAGEELPAVFDPERILVTEGGSCGSRRRRGSGASQARWFVGCEPCGCGAAGGIW